MAGLSFLTTFLMIFVVLYPKIVGAWLAKVKAGYDAASAKDIHDRAGGP